MWLDVPHRHQLEELRRVCVAGDLAAAKRLGTQFGFGTGIGIFRAPGSILAMRFVPVLGAACEHGHLGVARWLVATSGIGRDDARAAYNYALRVWAPRRGAMARRHIRDWQGRCESREQLRPVLRLREWTP
jgi:hypothetical protein